MVPSLFRMKVNFLSNLNKNKKNIREKYRRRRDAFVAQLDGATRTLAFRRPPSPLAALIKHVQTIAVYNAVGSEAPTARLIEYLMEEQKTVALPLVTGPEPLEFRTVSNISLLELGFKDIPEPSPECPVVIPDIIIAPLVAFDRSLNRLGQGGGHYDRSFAKYPDATRVGLAWSVQEAGPLPVGPHDVTLQMIITESEIIQKDSATS
ncbi:5-formyltetrahydrofolate cyclo-ligase [hydrothermal vent metagenome]|uniref:5-formyltetrahydrofolate cyclo-ligase n=1 Tax=hydrothermal vent metagenome TaxID=652676 RepID=A0A3B0RU84_9ZZZZ